jgi:hypothetical protein
LIGVSRSRMSVPTGSSCPIDVLVSFQLGSGGRGRGGGRGGRGGRGDTAFHTRPSWGRSNSTF